MQVKEGNKYILHSENGLDYKVVVINVNDYREPSMRYAIEITDLFGVSYLNTAGDYLFCGDDLINKCEFIS